MCVASISVLPGLHKNTLLSPCLNPRPTAMLCRHPVILSLARIFKLVLSPSCRFDFPASGLRPSFVSARRPDPRSSRPWKSKRPPSSWACANCPGNFPGLRWPRRQCQTCSVTLLARADGRALKLVPPCTLWSRLQNIRRTFQQLLSPGSAGQIESYLLSRVRRWRHACRALSLDVLVRFAKEPRSEIYEQPAVVL